MSLLSCTHALYRFRNADRDFSARHEAKSDLEAYLHTCELGSSSAEGPFWFLSGEQSISAPELSAKIKRGARGAVEAEIAKALEKLEQEDASADELKKAQLGVKRAMWVHPSHC